MSFNVMEQELKDSKEVELEDAILNQQSYQQMKQDEIEESKLMLKTILSKSRSERSQ